MGLKIVRLEHIRSQADGICDPPRSYIFQAFLKSGGELVIDGYAAISRLCKVIKFQPETPGHYEGMLVLTSDGWMLTCDGSGRGQRFDRLNARSLAEGDYVSIAEDGVVDRLFKVVSVKDAEVEVLAS